MNIKIVKIIDPGLQDKERLFMKAVASDNIGFYIVFDTIQTEPGKFQAGHATFIGFQITKLM